MALWSTTWRTLDALPFARRSLDNSSHSLTQCFHAGTILCLCFERGDKYSFLLMTPLFSLLPQSSGSKTSPMQDQENMDNLQGSSKSDNKSEKVIDTPKLTRYGHEIPRPKNCFLAYRMKVASALVESGVDNNIPNISKLVADLWRTEPEAVKQRYREIAAKEKKEHKQL
jgi:hypothetical protein